MVVRWFDKKLIRKIDDTGTVDRPRAAIAHALRFADKIEEVDDLVVSQYNTPPNTPPTDSATHCSLDRHLNDVS